jgi:hypothetical protein
MVMHQTANLQCFTCVILIIIIGRHGTSRTHPTVHSVVTSSRRDYGQHNFRYSQTEIEIGIEREYRGSGGLQLDFEGYSFSFGFGFGFGFNLDFSIG